MRQTILILFSLIVFHFVVDAQQVYAIRGKIVDASQKPVRAASVHLLNSNRGAVSDNQGSFEIEKISAGKYTIQVSAIGFAAIEKELSVGQDQQPIEIQLNDASVQLEAVLVSAQKSEEFLQKVPFSISGISARQVQQYRLWNSQDITAIVPNLYSANPGDNRNVTSIRGITSTSYDPAVATYIDGVNQFGLDTYIGNLLDVERIEVLRGPQSTLYGRNAMGGVINIITKQPTNKMAASGEISIGNHGQQRYSLAGRMPLVKNRLFIGVAGLYESRDGYYENEFDNTSFDRQHQFTGNYYLSYFSQSNWKFNLNFKNHSNRNNGAFPLVNGKEDALENPFKLNQDATAKMIDNVFNASLSANYSGKAINFVSQTAYQTNHRYYNHPLDGDFSPIDGVTIINDYGDKWNNVKVLTQEFRVSSPASIQSKLKWTAGTYFFYQDNPVKQAVHFGDDAALVGAPEPNFSIINSTKGKSSGWALFGQVSYAVSQKIDLIAGLRYDHEHKKYDILGQYQKDPDPQPQFDIRPDTSAQINFDAFSPKFGIALKADPNTNLYVTYSRGYRTGGLTQLSSDPSQPPLYPYKPEYSNNFEAGVKSNLCQNHLRINVAAFLIHVTDAQIPTLLVPDAVTVTRNAGKLSSKGVELELAATPAKDWEISYNFGFTDAKYQRLKLSQNGSAVDLDGKRQVFTPNTTSALVVQYSAALVPHKALRLVVRGEWFWLGKQYFDLSNTISQEAYHLFNTRMGISLKDCEFMIWTRNLGDHKYIAYAYDFGAIHLGDPLTWGITCSFHL